MHYIQFYHYSVNGETLVEACGDRAVFILDGRNTLPTRIHDGQKRAKQLDGVAGFVAFTVHAGQTFTRSRRISPPYPCGSMGAQALRALVKANKVRMAPM